MRPIRPTPIRGAGFGKDAANSLVVAGRGLPWPVGHTTERRATPIPRIPSQRWTAWLLLRLAAVYQAYAGLSSILLTFLGEQWPGVATAAWFVAMVILQLAVAVRALMLAAQQDIRGATFAVAACILLGWLSAAPSMLQHGLDFGAGGGIASGYFVLAPVIALTAATLARRGSHPVLAAFIVTAPTCASILFIIVFAAGIAIHGF